MIAIRLKISCVVVLSLISGGRVEAVLTIDASTTIDASVDESVTIVAGANPPTVVDILTPAMINGQATVFDDSVVNMWGGTIRTYADGEYGGNLMAYDSSEVNISGGSVFGNFRADESSAASISGGWFGGYVSASPPATLQINGYRLSRDGTHVTGFLSDYTRFDKYIAFADERLILNQLPEPPAVVIDSNTVIDADNSFNGQRVDLLQGPNATIVDVVAGGKVGALFAEGSNLVNLSGGEIRSLEVTGSAAASLSGNGVAWELDVGQTGHVDVDGGRIGHLRLDDSAVVDFLDGTAEAGTTVRDFAQLRLNGGDLHDRVTVFDSSTVHVLGGRIFGSLNARGSSVISLSGGAFLGDDSGISAHDSSTVFMTGGEIASELAAGGTSIVSFSGGIVADDVQAGGASTVNFSGGTIGESLKVHDHGTAHVFGFGLHLDGGFLRGTLADGTRLKVHVSTSGNGRIVLHEVPEPATCVGLLWLAVIGIALLAGKRRDGNPFARCN